MSDQATKDRIARATERYAEASLPTEHGEFRMLVYRHGTGGEEEAVAMVRGDLSEVSVLVRVHSECMTGEVLGSLRCDCRAQLNLALARIADEGGVLVYLRQEGRGIGLGNKVKAYALQDAGRDTVDANLDLGFDADGREYAVAADIMVDLGVRRVRLMTNNPDKVAQLEAAGIEVVAEPHWAEADERSDDYINTKRTRLGHTHDESAMPDATAATTAPSAATTPSAPTDDGAKNGQGLQ